MKKVLFIAGFLCIILFAGFVLADSENSSGVNSNKNGVINKTVTKAGDTTTKTKEITTPNVNIIMTKTITRTCDEEDEICTMDKSIIIEKTKDNVTIIKSKNISVTITREVETDENNRTYVKIDSIKREIKIMPETASARALERLGLKVCNESNNCTIVLKEVGTGNQTRMKYEINARKKVRFLWFFSRMKKVKAQVDAESGEVS